MNIFFICVAFLAFFCAAETTKHGRNPPKVQVYSHNPSAYGDSNMLICMVSNFHPPDISIHLMKDGRELPSFRQTDLAFNSDWHFHLMHSASFTPQREDKFLCRVNHGGRITDYEWDPNM